MKVMYMKKFLIVLLILFIILAIGIYSVYRYRSSILETQKLNREYEQYYNIYILGTELISIINRTSDINHKNDIAKDDNGYYVDNGDNSLHIYIKFVYKNNSKTIQMEDIEKSGSETFIKVYSTASFKCTKIEYHEKTHNVKSLTFEEVVEN